MVPVTVVLSNVILQFDQMRMMATLGPVTDRHANEVAMSVAASDVRRNEHFRFVGREGGGGITSPPLVFGGGARSDDVANLARERDGDRWLQLASPLHLNATGCISNLP